MPKRIANGSLADVLLNFDKVPDAAIIRPNNAAHLLGYSISTYWREVKRGRLRLVHPSPGTSGTPAGDIRAVLAAKV